MPATMQRFGVALKTTPQPDETLKVLTTSDRAKASVYSWDDERLQSTAVVQKRITKAATMVQRFIRACISHWQYYNEERLPLLEELEDIKRRRREELEEVEEFKRRGLEQALFEFEAELAMPKEEFEKRQKLSKDLKQEIKDEEAAIQQLSKDIMEERDRAKKLGREEHEIKAQHTLSRLDVEVPALEAEKKELEGIHDQFLEVVNELKGQYDNINLLAGLEERHRKRLIKCMAKILKKLEARGAKPKVINAVKLSIMYKGEAPPPKPTPPKEPTPKEEPAPAAEQPTTAAKETDGSEDLSPEDGAKSSEVKSSIPAKEEPAPTAEQPTIAGKEKDDSVVVSPEACAISTDVESPTPAKEEPAPTAEQPTIAGKEKDKSEVASQTAGALSTEVKSSTPAVPEAKVQVEPKEGTSETSDSEKSDEKVPVEDLKDSSNVDPSVLDSTQPRTKPNARRRKSAKKSKSPESKKQEASETFDWGDKERVAAEMRASATKTRHRSTSPTKKKKTKDTTVSCRKEKPNRSKSVDWEKFALVQHPAAEGRKAKPRRSKSMDWEKIKQEEEAKMKKEIMDGEASFNWSEHQEVDKKGRKSVKTLSPGAAFDWSAAALEEEEKSTHASSKSKLTEGEASFNWSAAKLEEEKKGKKNKLKEKNNEKGKSKKKSPERNGGKSPSPERKGKSRSTSRGRKGKTGGKVADDGHFSWVDHAK